MTHVFRMPTAQSTPWGMAASLRAASGTGRGQLAGGSVRKDLGGGRGGGGGPSLLTA